MNALAPTTCPAEPMRFHPFAELFPLLVGDAYWALVDDIRTHGVREPIVMLDGAILDGRNRYLAAREAGAAYSTIDFHGDDPLSYVISLNLKRRHLNESQRAMVASKIANLDHGGNRRSVQVANLPLENAPPPITQAGAAALLNVSERSIRTARDVREHGAPELIERVETGEVSVSAAAEVAKLPVEEQAAIVEQGPAAVREAAKEIRETGIVNRTNFTGNNEWFTPAEHIERARKALGAFDLDPASNPQAQETVQAAAFYTEEDNGLTKEWTGRVWLNPPYAQPAIGHFIDKLVEEVAAGRTTEAILLTHNYTDTAWFQKAAHAATVLCFTRGRVRFVSPAGELAAPTQGQAFFYFGPNVERFEDAFKGVGFLAELRQ